MTDFAIQFEGGGPVLKVRCALCRAAIETVEVFTTDESPDGSNDDASIEDVEIDSATQEVKCPTCDTRFNYDQVKGAIREFHRKLGEQVMIDMNRRYLKKPGTSVRKTTAKAIQLTGPFVIE